MKILIRRAEDIPVEEAHGGSGSRKLHIDDKQTPSERIQGMAHGWIPAGGMFDWHDHDKIEEVMYVIAGTGKVYDEDGEYPYGPGDVFIYPANTKHKIDNPTDTDNEFVFTRIYV